MVCLCVIDLIWDGVVGLCFGDECVCLGVDEKIIFVVLLWDVVEFILGFVVLNGMRLIVNVYFCIDWLFVFVGGMLFFGLVGGVV